MVVQKMAEIPLVLTIAGFDPSSGAGATADLKTISALGGYGVACLTALTVQSSLGVFRVHTIDAGVVRETLARLVEDMPPAAIKIGMLGTGPRTGEVVEAVAEFLEGWRSVPSVLDPVLRSSSGVDLLDSDGFSMVKERILPLVGWVTPNLAEAALLSGRRVEAAGDIPAAAAELQRQFAALNVVVTGGHLGKPDDYFLAPGSAGVWVEGERVETRSTHGTGCAFSTALAVSLAKGAGAEEAVRAAKAYVTGALKNAPAIGKGRGPLAHFWRLKDSSE
jgi:hydroxymethylpyrimidine/phosphomethylpyrimidine kinase